ncbi:alpha/beta-hydrolase [Aspergillus steynii IBT 23096]|uniref:Alpha/beta-hydrolase n=1 Tax=Aspergillus steynii IBT 23096 TaxID=1392250 RepID=A0A2I2G815_9EURO|nr:alpha/beta-hydrolase [Aspergillus steynii IBT 23096]PLB49032.1 alpha/beta-hydrolase [Aspergillus steynii IBT 23096]
MSTPQLVLPRPGTTNPQDKISSISAPSESSFIATFGSLLPAASYLQTPHGRAAYYSLPPSSQSTTSISHVLLIHGVQTPSIGLYPLVRSLSALSPSTHYILLDLWGHGLSDTPVAPHTPELFHDLISALLDHLAWKTFHLIGYSFGGSTVVSFAGRYPERALSMALIAPAGLIPSKGFSEVERGYLDPRKGNGDAEHERKAREWILDFLEGGELVVPADWEERVSRGEVVAEAVRDVVGVFRDGGVLDRHAVFEEVMRRGEVWGFSVLGELDGVCGLGDLEAVGMRKEDVVVVKGVGHAVVRERAEEVAQLIEGFWKKV